MRPIKDIIKDLFCNPRVFLKGLLMHCSPLIKNDKLYLEWLWYLKFGRKLDLKNPQTFNEKLQWLKLYSREPIFTTMVDKYASKGYVAGIIGDEHIIPTFGVWDKPEDIDWDALPQQFVLKCTHDSDGNVICRDKSKLNIAVATERLNRSLKRKYYSQSREWPYKNVPPKIIGEKFMTDEFQKVSGLMDYKFYCFDGEPKLLYISTGFENHATASISFITLDWEFAPFRRSDFKPFDILPPKPEHFDTMMEFARMLSNGFPFLRVDMYEIDHQVYFSELTFSPCGGMMPFEPEEWDYKMGSWLTLPEK